MEVLTTREIIKVKPATLKLISEKKIIVVKKQKSYLIKISAIIKFFKSA